jgi:hypothetical protein
MWQFIPGIFEKAPHGPFLHWAGSLGSKGRERESGWASDNSCHRSHCFAPKKPSTPYCNRPLVIQYYTSLGSHHTAGVAPNPITQRLARTIPTTLSLVPFPPNVSCRRRRNAAVNCLDRTEEASSPRLLLLPRPGGGGDPAESHGERRAHEP